MSKQKNILYIDMDDVICDYKKAFERALNFTPDIAYPQSQYGFYSNLLPVEDAVESVKKLIQSKMYDTHILTAPSIRNPFSYTEKRIWIEKHFGINFTQKLIISPNKGLLKGDILVDDNISGHGQENFDGKLIEFGSNLYPNWKAVLQHLKV